MPGSGRSSCVDLCGWTDTGDCRAQVRLLSQAAQCQLADSMPTPCLVSALCPLWPRPELPPPSCADLRVHSCLWVHDQRESQQHHDDPAGAHSAAEQVPSKSGPGQPRPRCWWFAVLSGRGLAKAMAPSRRLSEVSSAELAGEMLWEFKQREGRGGSLGICVGGTRDVVTARGPFLSLPS